MRWEALSSSNLALIKYMGKEREEDIDSKNIPLNPSLSYTLNHFVTKVRLQKSDQPKDEWRAYEIHPFVFDLGFVLDRDFKKDSKKKLNQVSEKKTPKKYYRSSQVITFDKNLSLENQKKFLDFFQFLKKKFFIPGFYVVNSANNFPLSAGAASSASSFSALTLATYKVAKEISSRPEFVKKITKKDLSAFSRFGSGSSCRSFFSPWAYWEKTFASPYECSFKNLIHQLIVVDKGVKPVSSRQAHKRVLKSSHFKGRVERAKSRLQKLKLSLETQNWKACFEITWEEFMDMHQLFKTSEPPFVYKNRFSEEVLNDLDHFWREKRDGPLVTMDAGANIHLLYREDQKRIAQEIEKIFSHHLVLSSDIE